MGNRAKCYICDAYTSEVLSSFRNKGKCPYCGASSDDSWSFEILLRKKESLQTKKISAELVDKNFLLEKENLSLKASVGALYNEFYNLVDTAEEHAKEAENLRNKLSVLMEKINND